MGGSSVAGGDIEDRCVNIAGMLNLDIYDTPRDSLPPELITYWDINKSEWKEEWKIDTPDGFRCAFYVPKAAKKGEEANACPPVLVFRGSDGEPEDFAELAFATKLDMTVVVDKPRPMSDTVIPFPFENSFSPSDKYTGKSMADLDGSGLQKETLFSGATGSKRIPIEVSGYFDAEVRVDWTMESALYYGVDGDWAVDFAQGLGQATSQYQSAVEAGKRAAADAEKDYSGRLIMTGHSLGGGLASCAAIAARKAKPDLKMRVQTYNAAGLHKNTAASAGGTLATAGEVPVNALHVKDELLNSMQSQNSIVPIVSDLLKWGKKFLPPAVVHPQPTAGISPGAMSISGKVYAPKGKALPVLYPLDNQTLVDTEFTVGAWIANRAAAAPDVSAFFDAFVDLFIRELSAGKNLTKPEAEALEAALSAKDAFPATLKDKMKEAILNDGELPTIDLEGGDYINQRVEPFFNSLIADMVGLARILLASGEYHTFPPCAFTLILPFLKSK